MPEIIIEGVCTELPNEKRCYLPGIVLKSLCPKCGHPQKKDLGSDYLSYGSLDVGFYCYDEKEIDGEWKSLGCGHEWHFRLKATIRLEVG